MIVTGIDRRAARLHFNGMFVSDMMASVLKMFTMSRVALCLVYSRVYMADGACIAGSTSCWRCSRPWG